MRAFLVALLIGCTGTTPESTEAECCSLLPDLDAAAECVADAVEPIDVRTCGVYICYQGEEPVRINFCTE